MVKRPTESQIAKARYDEAHQILDAWNHRVATAQAAHYNATRNGGDELETKRTLNALEIEREDAKTRERVSRQQWIRAAA